MKNLAKISAFALLIIFFANCEKNITNENQLSEQNIVINDSKNSPLLFNDLYNDLINSGGVEVSTDSLDLNNMSFHDYSKASLININGEYILLLKFDEEMYYANMAECTKKLTVYTDPKTNKITGVKCDGEGNECAIEIFVYSDMSVSVTIIICN
jgi:hypothetical protein